MQRIAELILDVVEQYLSLIDGDEEEKKKIVRRYATVIIEDLKEKMDIPVGLDVIQDKDVPQIIRWAMKEGNPLYPVPVMWNAKELQMFYEQILEKQSYSIEELVEKQRAFFYQGKTLVPSANSSWALYRTVPMRGSSFPWAWYCVP